MPDPDLFRALYTGVGAAYRWTDRLPWSDERLRQHLADPAISIWILRVHDAAAGWFELVGPDDQGSVEIGLFGLMPDFVGRGLGRHLLSEAIRCAVSIGATRVWLHTCTLDHPAALPNYLARGFTPFRTETYTVD